MATPLDSVFGIHEQALAVHSRRTQVLASNLANADTPHYKARDIDFKEVLGRESGGSLGLVTSHPDHLSTGGPGANLKYRNPYNPSLDGNTVETDVEQAEFAANAVQYQASIAFISGRIRGLRDAITGAQ